MSIRETLEDKYAVGRKLAMALNRYIASYVSPGSVYLGDKMVHLRGRTTTTAAALGTNADGESNNRFTFSALGHTLAPNGGNNAVDVLIRPSGGDWKELMPRIGFYCTFDEGLYAATPSSLDPTITGSSITINQSIPADTEIHVKVY